MASLKQVAERAGVSPATVSRALSGSPGVSPAARERVLRAAAEMDFRPNRQASNLRRQKTATIGVVVSDIENPHFTQMVRIVEAEAYARGFRVMLCTTDETADRQRACLDMLAEERVEGVILVPFDPDADEIARLLGMGIPVVAFDRMVSDPRADAVIVDNVGGARRATEHLLDAGHQRVGFVGGWGVIQTGAERLAGYEAAMRARGLPPLTANGTFRIDGGRAATEELLDREGSVSAIVVANNLMAIGTLRALRSRGVRVPQDIAMVAIDDPYWAELVDPPLTTLAQPTQRMAESAAELLFTHIAEGRPSRSTCLVSSFELRPRGSCGTLSRSASLLAGSGPGGSG